VVESVLEEVDDLLVGGVDYGSACTCGGSRLVPS
jgi:hypothetical protein